MLSVVHVIARMPASGTELQLVGTLKAAVAAQEGRLWNPTLCVLYPGFPLSRAVADAGIPVIELDGTSRLHLDRLRALRRVVRDGGFDVLHTSLWGGSAFGRVAALGPARPATVMSERRVEDFRKRPARLLDQVLRRVTDEWIGNSTEVGDFVERAHRAPRSRVHVIRNGIDRAVFHPGPARDRSPQDVPTIGALGRLVHQKGFDVLLKALPAVLAERPVRLVVAGEGELRGELEHAAAGLPVSLPGALKGGGAVADFLRGLDLFVMPSRFEGLPNAVLEALACGTPVVATDVPGMAEAAGSAARIVPPDDPRSLAQAILAGLAEPATGKAPPVDSFETVARAHLQVFEHAVARRAGRRAADRSTAPGRQSPLSVISSPAEGNH
jgi:glycosyltransferase involved in cell wall biosynthesis